MPKINKANHFNTGPTTSSRHSKMYSAHTLRSTQRIEIICTFLLCRLLVVGPVLKYSRSFFSREFIEHLKCLFYILERCLSMLLFGMNSNFQFGLNLTQKMPLYYSIVKYFCSKNRIFRNFHHFIDISLLISQKNDHNRFLRGTAHKFTIWSETPLLSCTPLF